MKGECELERTELELSTRLPQKPHIHLFKTSHLREWASPYTQLQIVPSVNPVSNVYQSFTIHSANVATTYTVYTVMTMTMT